MRASVRHCSAVRRAFRRQPRLSFRPLGISQCLCACFNAHVKECQLLGNPGRHHEKKGRGVCKAPQRRLNNSPRIPAYNRGRGEWIRKNMEMLLGQKLSAEFVSNWFSRTGATRQNQGVGAAPPRRRSLAFSRRDAPLVPGTEGGTKHPRRRCGQLCCRPGGSWAAVPSPLSNPAPLIFADADFFAILKGKAHLVKSEFRPNETRSQAGCPQRTRSSPGDCPSQGGH